jgi:chorismate-pyruvate lyase
MIHRITPELEFLAKLYYRSVDELGEFQEVRAEELPSVYRMLLAHDQHMTVTLEAYHGCRVEVTVLDSTVRESHYQRKSILRRQTDGAVVLLGIVRIARALLTPGVRQAIEAQRTPLGRILIRHNVLRNVRPLSYWRIVPGEDLCRLFDLQPSQVCYGRTAIIYCDTLPAIELLEVVTAR